MKNILCAFLTAVFVLGTIAVNAQTRIYVHKTDGTANEYNIADLDSISFTPPTPVDYTKLILTEVSGNNKYVEIYNSGTENIPMKGVRLVRNDGPPSGSEWPGITDDIIPAGAYRLFLFNSFTAGLDTNPAFVGWTVGSGISSGQILKVAIVAPNGDEVSVFIRGDVPLPAWQNTTGVTQNTTDTYSLMEDGTWAYADPTPGAANGTKKSEIENPGYLTATP